jgi:secreted trypsin-like serine protease
MPIAPKIIGGAIATLGQFPYHAAILVGGSTMCGGSLIARDWVLTSARCGQA